MHVAAHTDQTRAKLWLASATVYDAPMTRKKKGETERHADNVADPATSRKPSPGVATTGNRPDNAPDSMDYVQSGDYPAAASPTVERRSVSRQSKFSQRAPRKLSESLVSGDRIVKNLYGVRREIHNRLGRIEAMEDRLATAKMALAELEVRERELVFELWQQSPASLEHVNESTRRWRRRK